MNKQSGQEIAKEFSATLKNISLKELYVKEKSNDGNIKLPKDTNLDFALNARFEDHLLHNSNHQEIIAEFQIKYVQRITI